MINLKLNEGNQFEFSMEIDGEGAEGRKPVVMFTIVDGDARYSYVCEHGKSGSYTANVPAMEKLLEGGVYESEINVIVGDRFFTPYTESCKFEEDMKIAVTEVKVNKGENLEKPVVAIKSGISARPILEQTSDLTPASDGKPKIVKKTVITR